MIVSSIVLTVPYYLESYANKTSIRLNWLNLIQKQTRSPRRNELTAAIDGVSTREKQMKYTRNELKALYSIFTFHAEETDEQSNGHLYVYPSQMFEVINNLSRNQKELTQMKSALSDFQQQQRLQRRDPASSTAAAYGVEASSDSSTLESIPSTTNNRNVEVATDIPMGCIAFETFASIIDAGRQTQTADTEESQLHFFGIAKEYQNRCDSQGKYLLAKVFMDHISSLRKEVECRVVMKVKDKLIDDRTKIVEAHEKQLLDFKQSE